MTVNKRLSPGKEIPEEEIPSVTAFHEEKITNRKRIHGRLFTKETRPTAYATAA